LGYEHQPDSVGAIRRRWEEASTMKTVYAVLCVLGFVLPYYFLISFLASHGLDVGLFFNQLFANPVSAFFAADVVVSSLVFWFFMYEETRKRPIELWWVCVLANLAVGVSLGLPLFLLLREFKMERETAKQGASH
jgi:hypothetical protein